MPLLSDHNSLSDNPLFLKSAPGKSLTESPLGFIDIGARGGAHDFVEPIARLAAILAFEPDHEECKRLLQTPEVVDPWAAFHIEPIALADKKAATELVLLSAATNHSLLPPNTDFTHRYEMTKWTEIGREKLETETLDAVLFNRIKGDYRWGELIKLDTQGTEYEILKGATRTLTERTVAIVTEVSFCELYKGQKLFSEVELMLREFGFSFYGFPKIHTRSCKLLDKRTHITSERAFYADAIFFKDPLPGATNRQTLDERGNYALFTSALLLGFYDFALELACKTWAREGHELGQITELVSQISHQSPDYTYQSLMELTQHVGKETDQANIIVGGFVDQHRKICNYDDVLDVTALPKML